MHTIEVDLDKKKIYNEKYSKQIIYSRYKKKIIIIKVSSAIEEQWQERGIFIDQLLPNETVIEAQEQYTAAEW